MKNKTATTKKKRPTKNPETNKQKTSNHNTKHNTRRANAIIISHTIVHYQTYFVLIFPLYMTIAKVNLLLLAAVTLNEGQGHWKWKQYQTIPSHSKITSIGIPCLKEMCTLKTSEHNPTCPVAPLRIDIDLRNLRNEKINKHSMDCLYSILTLWNAYNLQMCESSQPYPPPHHSRLSYLE